MFTASGEMRFRHGSTSPKVTWVRLCALAADEMGGKPEPSPHVLEFCGCMRSAGRYGAFPFGRYSVCSPSWPLSKSHEVNFPSRPRVRSDEVNFRSGPRVRSPGLGPYISSPGSRSDNRRCWRRTTLHRRAAPLQIRA